MQMKTKEHAISITLLSPDLDELLAVQRECIVHSTVTLMGPMGPFILTEVRPESPVAHSENDYTMSISGILAQPTTVSLQHYDKALNRSARELKFHDYVEDYFNGETHTHCGTISSISIDPVGNYRIEFSPLDVCTRVGIAYADSDKLRFRVRT